MALFKISKGQSENLSNQPLTEGYSWFTPDDGKFYIDAKPSSSSAVQRIPLNAHLADNLRTPVKISLTTGALGNTNFDGSKDVQISVTSLKEAYLDWGGRNLTGQYSALDAALVPTLGANRFAFMPAAGITIEYSRDGGSTWTNYGASDQMKVQLFDGEGTNLRIGAGSSQTGVDKSKYQVRVTIDSVAAKVYTQLKKFVIDISTEGSTGAWVTIDGKTRTNVVAGTDTWTTFTNKQGISGWSAFNIINVSGITTYSNNNAQYQKLRFTFGVTSHASTVEYPGLTVRKIYGYGGMVWTAPSNLAGRGTIYTYDYQQNVFFPNRVQVEGLTIYGGVGIQTTAPTDPTHLVNKKYVDDKLSAAGVAKRYTVTCTTNQNSISFPTTFPDLDSMAIYHNGLLLTPTINYSINTNGTGIDLVGYSAEEGDLITFVATVEASNFTDEKIVKGEVITTAGQTVINIPFTIVSTTGLAVYENGILISEGNQYSATTTAITLLGYTANSGDIYTFVSDRALAGLSFTPNAATTTLSSTAFSGITNVKDALEHCLPLSGGDITGTINFANGFSMTDKNNNRIAVVEDVDNNNAPVGFGIFGAQAAVVSTTNASNGIIVNNSMISLVGNTVVSGASTDSGAAVVRNIMYSTSVPTSSQGEDGDICIVYTP